jgi:hypothetical protein
MSNPTARQLLRDLRDACRTQVNERRLLAELETTLTSCRRLYRNDRNVFTAGEVEELKLVRAGTKALGAFQKLLPDVQRLRSREDADEIVCRLQRVRGPIADWAVAARIDKEIREIRARARNLPCAEDVKRKASLNHKLIQLEERERKRCPKCGDPMSVKNSPSGYAWRCAEFPRCKGYQKLTRSEREFVFGR